MPHPEPPARRAQAQTAPSAEDLASPLGGAIHACPACRCGQPEPRSWRIEFRPGTPLLSSNHREHWAAAREITAPIKDTAIVLARAAKIPRGLLRVAITAEFRQPPGRECVVREAHNLTPVVKAAIDGIAKAGVIADDADKYVASVTYQPGPPHPLGQLILIITEVTSGETHP